MQFWVLGNPENRRVSFFAEAVRQAGFVSPHEISYESFITHPVFPQRDEQQPICLRIDSPGENTAVRKALILAGLQQQQSAEVDELVADHGRIGFSRAWYSGFTALLEKTKPFLQQPGVFCMNHPDDIAVLFDKRKCHTRMLENAVPVPEALPAVNTYDELRAAMKNAGMKRVFIKPVHASSASGVIALRTQNGEAAAISSAMPVTKGTETHIYNELRQHHYRDEKTIATLVNKVLAENALVEQWIPKATINKKVFDLRVLVIAGKAQHIVVRTSNSVITNLHLGNQRGKTDEIIAHIGLETFERIKTTAEKAAACFPRSLYIAADMLLAADRKTIRVLETNAFGDLLPGVEYEGKSTYTSEIAVTAGRVRPEERT